MSAESGLKTFRDNDGLWENHSVYEVAAPEAWRDNPDLVLEFYNQRRTQLKDAEPNEGHRLLAEFEDDFDVEIITQNVDNLHERGGSSKIMHLHGELTKVRCTNNPNDIKDIGYNMLKKGDLSASGRQLRPHIVWFGESVPMIQEASVRVSEANALLIIGTSMQVYPAAGLMEFAPTDCPVYCINPDPAMQMSRKVHWLQQRAVEGLKIFREIHYPVILEG